MTPKHLFILLLALSASAVAQNDDELHIPEENDNQFPPDNHADLDGVLTEGSGAGVIDEPHETTTASLVPLEDVQLNSAFVDAVPSTTANEDNTCPQSCVCNIEGDAKNYIVDCSGAGLTELPTPLDIKTTQLNLQDNKLTSIPKDISALKNLKVLNANKNEIMQIDAGSISELPEITTLKLGNNRLLEYPLDLKNSFGLTKLEELDLGGNDMREVLNPETFSIFKSLRKLSLPSATPSLAEDLCSTLKDTLQLVCAESCEKSFECQNLPLKSGSTVEDELLDFALPGLLAIAEDENDPNVSLQSAILSASDQSVISPAEVSNNVTQAITIPSAEKDTASNDNATPETTTVTEANIPIDAAVPIPSDNTELTDASPKIQSRILTQDNVMPPEEKDASTAGKNSTSIEGTVSESTTVNPDSIRSAIMKAPEEKSEQTVAGASDDKVSKTETEVVGATTSGAKTGGVDKSVIGLVVAGMVVIIAGITIKKNWSSIRKRFSSSPRPANDRANVNGNGNAPEEVPLQEKSPV